MEYPANNKKISYLVPPDFYVYPEIWKGNARYSEPAIHVSKVSDCSIRESKRRPEVGGGEWILF